MAFSTGVFFTSLSRDTRAFAFASLVASAGLAFGQDTPSAPAAVDEPTEKAVEQVAPAADPDAFRQIVVGDAAPTLNGAAWIQGVPTSTFEKGTMYVIDFWATWCQPCIATIPELNAIHTDYRDKKVKVIGVSIWENARASDAGVDLKQRVKDFVTQRGSAMAYDIAYGAEDGIIAQRWMNAAGRVSIPSVFIIDRDGKLAWVGHPRMGLRNILDGVINNRADLKQVQAETQAREDKRRQAFALATPLQKHIEAKQWDEAIGVLDQIIALDTEMFAPSSVAKLRLLLTGKKDYAGASAFANACADGDYKESAVTLANMSILFLTLPDLETRDVALATKLANQANGITKDNPRVLWALAESQWANGEQEVARVTIEKALAVATSAERADITAAAARMKP